MAQVVSSHVLFIMAAVSGLTMLSHSIPSKAIVLGNTDLNLL